VVDRSLAGFDLASYHQGNKTVQASSTTRTPLTTGFTAGTTKLTATNTSTWTPGATYVFGVGATRDIIVLSMNPPTTSVANGQTTYSYTIATPASGFQFSHWLGEPFSSSFIPGNPGPQPNFNYASSPYNLTVVPYTARLQ
jgi:hypothetical protein